LFFRIVNKFFFRKRKKNKNDECKGATRYVAGYCVAKVRNIYIK